MKLEQFINRREALEWLTEWRYASPLYVGSTVVKVKRRLLKMRIEGWSADCFDYARRMGKLPVDFTREVFQEWDQEESVAKFRPLKSFRGFDDHCGDFGQHFAFYWKPESTNT